MTARDQDKRDVTTPMTALKAPACAKTVTNKQEGAEDDIADNDAKPSEDRCTTWPWWARGLAAAFGTLAFLTACLCGGVWWLAHSETRLESPDWLTQHIEQSLVDMAPDIRVSFGNISLFAQTSGQLHVALSDVSVVNLDGHLIAQLSALEAGLSGWDLLQGDTILRNGRVSGAFITVLRDKSGRLGLALGDAFSDDVDAPDVPTMITTLDNLAQSPLLEHLDDLEADGMTIRYEDARARRGWTVDGGRVLLERRDTSIMFTADMALLGGGASVASLQLHAESEIGKTSAQFGFALEDLPAQDIATQSPALAWLEALRAPISGTFRSGIDENGNLLDFDASLKIAEGVVQPSAATTPIRFQEASAAFRFLRKDSVLDFQKVTVLSDSVDVSLSGKAALRGVENGWLDDLEGQFSVSYLRLAEGLVFDQEETIEGADLAFKLRPNPFQITVGEVHVKDPRYPLKIKGQVSARADGWHTAIDAEIEETSPDTVLKLWPSSKLKGPRNWIAQHVHEGQITNAIFAMRLVPETRPDVFVDFNFEEARVSFADGFADVAKAGGHFSLYKDRMVVQLAKGETSPNSRPVDLAGSQIVVADFKQRPALFALELKSRGPVGGYLDYIDQEPLKILEKSGFSPDLATGQAVISGTLDMPIRGGLTKDDIRFNFGGTVRDAASDALLENKPLRSDSLDLTISNTLFTVSGRGTLSGAGFEGTYRQPLGTGERPVVDAEVDISDANLRALGITLPAGMLSGQGKGALTLAFGANTHRFDVTTNTRGLTMSLPHLNWRKPAGQVGSLSVSGTVGQTMSVDDIQLSAAGLTAAGSVDLTADGGFRALDLREMELANWLDVSGRLVGRGRQTPAVNLSGGNVDLRRATFGSAGAGSGGSSSVPMTVELNRLQVTDSIWLDRFRASFTASSAGMTGRFTGRLGGKTPVAGTMTPGAGGTSFFITGEDAGDIFAAAGFMDNVSDGAFELSFTPTRGFEGTYDGTMKIQGTRVRNAPAIGALLDAVSIVGILDEVNGSGIYFDTVEGSFRLTPHRAIITESSAVGPSMGVSLDGYYDLASGRLDMQGVLSPVYILNGIGRLFSARDGEGLIGFNFALKGTTDTPNVSVNPLSVFTPGMFREIFRRPVPKLEN